MFKFSKKNVNNNASTELETTQTLNTTDNVDATGRVLELNEKEEQKNESTFSIEHVEKNEETLKPIEMSYNLDSENNSPVLNKDYGDDENSHENDLKEKTKEENPEEESQEGENPEEENPEEESPKGENPEEAIATPIQEEPGIAQKIFNIASYIALPLLLLFTFALSYQQIFFPRDFWFSEEVRLADVYMNMLTSGNFLYLTLNNLPFADVNPLYFLSIFALDSLPYIDMPLAFFVSSTLFSMLYIGVTWLFARALGLNKQVAFASGLIALSTFFFIGLSNYNRMDLLYVSLFNLSLLLFYRGWKKDNGFFSLSFAFIFLALSVFVNNPIFITIPFFAGLLFLFWIGRLRRITAGDGLFGFFIMLLMLAAWFGFLYLDGQKSYINTFIDKQIINPILPAHTTDTPLWYYAAALPIIALPWTLIILFVDWIKSIRTFPNTFKTRKENSASTWLLCIIFVSLVFLTFTHDKVAVNLMLIMPAFSILCAKALLNLSPLRSKLFFGLVSALVFLLGLIFILFEFHAIIFDYLPKIWILPKEIPTFIGVATTNTYFGMLTVGVLFILTAIFLFRFTKRRLAGGSLFVLSLGFIISIQPLSILVAPQLDTILSTKKQGTLFAEYSEKDYVPASFDVYPDVFTYYYNVALQTNTNTYPQKNIYNIKNLSDFNTFISTNPKAIIAMPIKIWNSLPNKANATEVQKQWLESQEIIISLWNAPQLGQMPTESSSPTIQKEDTNTIINEQNHIEEDTTQTEHTDKTHENTQEEIHEEVINTQESAPQTVDANGSTPDIPNETSENTTESPEPTNAANELTTPETQEPAETVEATEPITPIVPDKTQESQNTQTTLETPKVDTSLLNSMEDVLREKSEANKIVDTEE